MWVNNEILVSISVFFLKNPNAAVVTIKFNSHTNNKTCIQNSTTERKTKRTAKLTMLLLPRLTKRVRAAILKRREARYFVSLIVDQASHPKPVNPRKELSMVA